MWIYSTCLRFYWEHHLVLRMIKNKHSTVNLEKGHPTALPGSLESRLTPAVVAVLGGGPTYQPDGGRLALWADAERGSLEVDDDLFDL